MYRVTKRVKDGRQIVRNVVRDFERVECRDHQIFREAARTVDAHADEPGRYTDRGVMETGSSSSGTGYTARAIIERRVTSNWFVGLGVDIQEAKDYTPSHALLYVRYSAAGWQGDMDLPPQPLIPYADW